MDGVNIMSSQLRKIYNHAFLLSLSVYGRIRTISYDIGNTIVISGESRSGKSWMAEILHTIPRSCILNEPIRPSVDSKLDGLGFSDRTCILPGDNRPEAEKWMRQLLSGRILNYNTSVTTVKEIIRCKYHIIKFSRATRLLRWMTEKFPTKPPILIIRHPCAVVASKILHGGWKNYKLKWGYDSRFIEAYPWVIDILRDIKTEEEVCAATWCMDYFAALSTPKPHPWILVSYEKLVNQGESELQRIFNALDMYLPEDAVKQLKVPSWSARKECPIITGEDLLADYKKFLSKNKIKRILDLVSLFGLNFYGEDLEPDYNRLENQPVVRHS